MKHYFCLFVLLIASVTANAQPSHNDTGKSLIFRTSPEKAITIFVGCFNNANPEMAADFVQGASESNPAFDKLTQVLTQQMNFIHVGITDIHTTIKNDTARVTLKVIFQDALLRKATQIESLQLKRSVGKATFGRDKTTCITWMIVPETPSAIFHSRQNNLIQTMAAYIAFPQQMLDESSLLSSRIRLEQIAHATKNFLLDWDNEFGPKDKSMGTIDTQENWREEVGLYTPSTSFNIPLSLSGEYFQFNLNLAGKKFADIKQPSKTVMVYDGEKQTLNFRHDGAAFVLFADGHISLINAKEATRLIWNP